MEHGYVNGCMEVWMHGFGMIWMCGLWMSGYMDYECMEYEYVAMYGS